MAHDLTPRHCWHDDGHVYPMMPPRKPQTCCRCGATRVETWEPDTNHGPFLKGEAWRVAYQNCTAPFGDECRPAAEEKKADD